MTENETKQDLFTSFTEKGCSYSQNCSQKQNNYGCSYSSRINNCKKGYAHTSVGVMRVCVSFVFFP